MTDFTAPFARSVRLPERPVPKNLRTPVFATPDPSSVEGPNNGQTDQIEPFRNNSTPTKRFSIYRNNHYVSLTEALEKQFPVVCRIVGSSFFSLIAREYAQEEPPTSPFMALYGSGFSAFLGRHPGCVRLPYLADVAHIEWSRACARQAADDPVIAGEDLAEIASDRLPSLCCRFRECVHFLTSPFPIGSIWETNANDQTVRTINTTEGGEDVLVYRVDREAYSHICVEKLHSGEYVFFRALFGGESIGQAAADAIARHPAFRLDGSLARVLRCGLIREVSLPRTNGSRQDNLSSGERPTDNP